MFKTILLPIDLTDRHDPALRIAADIARASAGRVVLLHVIELIPGIAVEEEREFYSRLERAAHAHLEKLGHALATARVTREAAVLYGSRCHEVIVRYAVDVGADLIILTSHRIDPAKPAAGWGTVSYKVGILSQCPVLLVK